MKEHISTERILSTLDVYLNRNDYVSAEKHLLYCLSEAEKMSDTRAAFLVRNELMGLYRKLGRRDDALACVQKTLSMIENEALGDQVGAATAFLNCATVYKAFSLPSDSLALFIRAKEIYERKLDKNDSRLGGLYNNMALTLVDLGRFSEAKELYENAIRIMRYAENGALETAITYLNLASAAEAELGLADADEAVQNYLDRAQSLLEAHEKRDGYYAFVCEKCASVFLYYGRFAYAAELTKRSEEIYKNERS